MNFLRKLLREPLFHFAILTGLIFAAQSKFATDSRETIRIDKATQEFLVKQRSELVASDLSAEARQQVIEDYINDEILVREAQKQGFDNSSRIRTLMVQNMRFFIGGDVGEPTEDELRQFFEDNPDRFTSPPSLDLDHVYFKQEPTADTLARLNGGADHNDIGDFDIRFSKRMRTAREKDLIAGFGRETAAQIVALEDRAWHGPYKSKFGYHYLRLNARNNSVTPDFETARSWISTQWLSARNRELIDRQLEEFRKNYHIIIDEDGNDG